MSGGAGAGESGAGQITWAGAVGAPPSGVPQAAAARVGEARPAGWSRRKVRRCCGRGAKQGSGIGGNRVTVMARERRSSRVLLGVNRIIRHVQSSVPDAPRSSSASHPPSVGLGGYSTSVPWVPGWRAHLAASERRVALGCAAAQPGPTYVAGVSPRRTGAAHPPRCSAGQIGVGGLL